MTDSDSEARLANEGVEPRKLSEVYGANVKIVDSSPLVEIDPVDLKRMSSVLDEKNEQEAQIVAETLPVVVSEDLKVAKEILNLWKKALVDKRGLVGISAVRRLRDLFESSSSDEERIELKKILAIAKEEGSYATKQAIKMEFKHQLEALSQL